MMFLYGFIIGIISSLNGYFISFTLLKRRKKYNDFLDNHCRLLGQHSFNPYHVCWPDLSKIDCSKLHVDIQELTEEEKFGVE